jgi:hypothetical protein
MEQLLESLFTMMVSVFTTVSSAVVYAYNAILTYLNSGNVSKMIWLLIVFALLVVVLLWRKWRPNLRLLRRDYPELLVSKGEIVQVQSSTIQTLHVKVSNLSDFPVQLLEFAIKTDLMHTPITVEAIEVLGSHEAIELEATMPVNVVGEKGDLKLYAYVTQPRKKVYVLRSEFVFEPWNGRHKVSPLGQTIRPIRRLASSQLERLRKQAWLEQYAPPSRIETPARSETHEAPKRPEITEPKRTPQVQQEPKPVQAREDKPSEHKRDTNDLEFPSEF